MKIPQSSFLHFSCYDQVSRIGYGSFMSEDEFIEELVLKEEDVVMVDPQETRAMEQVVPTIPAGWKTVEVVASFHPNEMQAGGGFLLRDRNGFATLVEAFPVSGYCPPTMEAFVLRTAMEKIISFGENRVVFIIDSQGLYNSLMVKLPVPVQTDVGSIIRDCTDFQREYEFLFLRRHRSELPAAEWLADCGMRCQQHCRWDIHYPWPPELGALVLDSTLPKGG